MARMRTISLRAGALAFGVSSGLFVAGLWCLAFWAGYLHADLNSEHAVHVTACPTPAQKEAAFDALPEPARLPHMDAEHAPAVPVDVSRAAVSARLRALLAEVEDGRLP